MMKIFYFVFLFSALSLFAQEVNLALNKPVTASSEERATLAAKLAVDGDVKTRWASRSVDPQWFTVDLEKPEKVGRIMISWENAYAKEYKIQVSMDGKTWKEVFFTNTGKGKKETVTFKQETARYVRFAGGQRVANAGYSFWEFQIFEK